MGVVEKLHAPTAAKQFSDPIRLTKRRSIPFVPEQLQLQDRLIKASAISGLHDPGTCRPAIFHLDSHCPTRISRVAA
jgi:hypothetical protein